MNHLLFFDTATTGLPKNFDWPAEDASNWARLLQLTWTICDKSGKIIKRQSHIIRPDGFNIPEHTVKFHGITTEKALASGRQIHSVLKEFSLDLLSIDTIIGHHVSFNEKNVAAEFHRYRIQSSLSDKNRICTMLAATDFCAIRRAEHGYKFEYKGPTLDQLHNKLFKSPYIHSHNAARDIEITMLCYWELTRRGIIKIEKTPVELEIEEGDRRLGLSIITAVGYILGLAGFIANSILGLLLIIFTWPVLFKFLSLTFKTKYYLLIWFCLFSISSVISYLSFAQSNWDLGVPFSLFGTLPTFLGLAFSFGRFYNLKK